MTAMEMGGRGSGAKGKPEDAQLLRDLAAAKANEPPRKVVKSWKSTVKKAVAAKKQGKR